MVLLRMRLAFETSNRSKNQPIKEQFLVGVQVATRSRVT